MISDAFLHMLVATVLNLARNEQIIKYFLQSSSPARLVVNSVLMYCYAWIIKCFFVGVRRMFIIDGIESKEIGSRDAEFFDSFSAQTRPSFELVPSGKKTSLQLFPLQKDSSDVEAASRPFLEMKSTFFDRNFQFAE